MAKRAEVLEEFPGIQAKEVMKLLGGKWRELSAEDKAVYDAMAKAEKQALAAGADKGACTPLCARVCFLGCKTCGPREWVGGHVGGWMGVGVGVGVGGLVSFETDFGG